MPKSPESARSSEVVSKFLNRVFGTEQRATLGYVHSARANTVRKDDQNCG